MIVLARGLGTELHQPILSVLHHVASKHSVDIVVIFRKLSCPSQPLVCAQFGQWRNMWKVEKHGPEACQSAGLFGSFTSYFCKPFLWNWVSLREYFVWVASGSNM